jgi:hypothetical protein
MASFPTTAKSFASRSNGQTLDAAHVGDLQDEVSAVESGYLGGTARLNSSHSTVVALSVTGGSTFAGAVTFGGGIASTVSFASSVTMVDLLITGSLVSNTALSGVQAFDDTQALTSTNTEAILYTRTVPANTLAVNGTTLRITACGTLAADTDSKTVRIRWGGIGGTIASVVVDATAAVTNWRMDALITRIGSNAQRLNGVGTMFNTSNNNIGKSQNTVATAAQSDTSAIDIVVTGTGVNPSDIVFEAAWVERLVVL